MKKIIRGFVFMFVLSGITAVLSAEDMVLYQAGSIEFLAPVINSSLVYMYDFVEARNLLGAETALVRVKSFYGVVGVAADVGDGNSGGAFKQIPFFGIHTPALVSLLKEMVTVGAFAGRDFKRGETVAGVKCSMKLW